MIDVSIPGFGIVAVSHLVLDMNGTIASGGVIHESLRTPLSALKSLLAVHVISADTFGTLEAMATSFGLQWHLLPRGEPEAAGKQAFVRELDPSRVIAMGNGNNDALMLEDARVGICVIGQEGAGKDAIHAADIVVHDPMDGLNLLLEPAGMKATLRR